MESHLQIIFIFFCTVFIGSAVGDYLQKPSNAAVLVGQPVVLYCQGDANDPAVLWQRAPTVVADDFNYLSFNEMNYANDVRIQVIYDDVTYVSILNITSVTAADAGTYACSLLYSAINAYSQLIVLASHIQCGSNIPVDAVTVGETLTVACEIPYYSAINWAPALTWTRRDGAILTPLDASYTNTLRQTYSQVIKAEDNGQQYKVTASFPAFDIAWLSSPEWDHATGTPLYDPNDFYETDPLYVLFPLTDLNFINGKTTYYVGDILTAQANGQPPPTYKWTRDDGLTVSGADLEMTNAFLGKNNWTCAATHAIKGTNYSLKRSIEFTLKGQGQPFPAVSSSSHLQLEVKLMVVGTACLFFIHVFEVFCL